MLKYQKYQTSPFKSFLSGMQVQMDIFGQPPGFTIFKKERFTTYLGAISTLSIFAFCLLYFYFEMENLFSRNKPTVFQYDTQLIESCEIPLTISNFTLAVSMIGLDTQPIKKINQYFQVNIKNCERKRVFNSTLNTTQVIYDCQDYPTEPCNENHMVTQVQKDYFSKIQLGSVQCIQSDIWKQNPPVLIQQNQKIQGIVQAMKFKFIQVQITLCKNTTNSSTCAPIEEIKNKMKSGYYTVHFTDNLLQMNEPINSISDMNTLQQTSFSIQSSRSIYQTFKRVTVLTDDGLVTTDIQSQEGLISNQWREAAENYNDNFIINHHIYLDEKQSSYSRSYIKIQTILGKIGGFWNVAVLLFRILITPVVLTLMNIILVNKLFRFEINNDQQLIKDEIKEELSSKDQLANSTIFKEPQNVLYKNQSINFNHAKKPKKHPSPKNNPEISNYLSQQKQQLNLGFIDIVLVSFCFKKKIKQQIQYAKQKCQEKLDVAFIINKIYELDKLKYILFTNEQLNLFNCLPKPIIPTDLFDKAIQNKIKALESQKQYKFMLEDEKPAKMKLEQAYQSFKKIKNKREKSEIDIQLIEFLDEDLIKLFESISRNELNSYFSQAEPNSLTLKDNMRYSVSNRLSNIPLDISEMSYDC